MTYVAKLFSVALRPAAALLTANEASDPSISEGGIYTQSQFPPRTWNLDEHRGALRGTPGSAYPQPEPNATELPSSAPGRPKLVRAASLRAFAFADTRRGTHRLPRPPPRAEENSARHQAADLTFTPSPFPSFAALLRHLRVPAHF